jgi:putative DNA primase/helicase
VVVAAALLGRKVGLRPKRHDDWTVIPNLWGGLVGPPASMKTPALEQVIKPVKRLAAEAQEAHQEAVKAHELDMMVAEAEKAALKKKLETTAKKVASGEASRGNLEDIRQELEELEEPEPPREKRYMTNDATIEKIAEILEHNPDGILYYRDELMGWLRSLDKPGRRVIEPSSSNRGTATGLSASTGSGVARFTSRQYALRSSAGSSRAHS